MRKLIWVMASAVTMAVATPAIADNHATIIDTAVAAKDRSEEEVKQDTSRKPAEVLKFLGLKPGDKAAEFLAGSGYYAKIMGHVVGSEGAVTAYNPPAFVQSERGLNTWSKIVSRPDNINLAIQDYRGFRAADASFDFAMMHLVYHDIYFDSERFGMRSTTPGDFVPKLFKAMKPGGIVGVIDHDAAAGGDVKEIASKLHRINRESVVADFTKAGFVLAAESKLLASDSDDFSKNVFDPAVRGKTDRFMLKFVKPE